MNYGDSPAGYGSPRPRSSGFGCLMLLVLGAIFLYVASMNRDQQEVEPPIGPPGGVTPAPRDVIPPPSRIDVPPQPQPGQITTEGDWSIEEVDVQQPPAGANDGARIVVPPANGSPAPATAPKRTEQGDWSIEEVKANPTQNGSPRASDPPPADKQPPKKTQQGDWEIEEVESQGSNTGAGAAGETPPVEKKPPKKTEQGDWEIEEVEAEAPAVP